MTHVFFLNIRVRTETLSTSDVRPTFLQPYSGSHNANTPFDRTMSACSFLSCCSYLWEYHSFGGILYRHPLNLHMLFAPCITLEELIVDTCVGLAHRGRGPLVQACLEYWLRHKARACLALLRKRLGENPSFSRANFISPHVDTDNSYHKDHITLTIVASRSS